MADLARTVHYRGHGRIGLGLGDVKIAAAADVGSPLQASPCSLLQQA